MAQEAVIAALEDWARVGAAVRDRRLELGLSQDDVGVSKAVASNLELAKQASFARSSLVRICQHLRWTTDSIDRLLAGGHPVEVATPAEVMAASQPATMRHIEDLDRRVARIEKSVKRLLELDEQAAAQASTRPGTADSPPEPA